MSNGPVPNAASRPSAPGKLVTHSETPIIHSMPCPMMRHHGASIPSGMVSSPAIPAGITQADTIGITARLAITPYGEIRWKW